jgi:hypothetical protein
MGGKDVKSMAWQRLRSGEGRSRSRSRIAAFAPVSLATLLALAPGAASAQSRIHADVTAGLGYSFISVPQDAAPPTLLQGGVGLTLGLRLGQVFMFGVTSDYRWISQLSAPDTVVGNSRGARWNMASPTLGFAMRKALLKLDFQLLGDYKLSNASSEGYAVSYRRPLGGRAVLALSGRAAPALFVEYVAFSRQAAGEETSLSSPRVLWQAGAALVIHLTAPAKR